MGGAQVINATSCSVNRTDSFCNQAT